MSNWQALPPGLGKCRICAVEHPDNAPHDATSFYYRVLFVNTYDRSPTWADAMAHCEPEVQQRQTVYLNKIGIDINSTQVLGDIKSKEDLSDRLTGGVG